MDQDRAQPLYEFKGHSICTVSYSTREFEAQYFASNNMHSTTHVHIANASRVCGRALHHQVYA